MGSVQTGSCLCGRVRFSVTGKLRDVVACHCHQCRKQSGHYYAATQARDADLEIRDNGALKWYHSSDRGKRGFCAECGSALFWKSDEETCTSILAGSFEEPTGLRLTRHIFVADKGDYYEIGDGLPQFGAGSEPSRIK
jgi:hypothetical protein